MNSLIYKQEIRILSLIQKTSKNNKEYIVCTAINEYGNIVQFNVVSNMLVRFLTEVKELTRIIAEFRVSTYKESLNLSIQDFIVSDVQSESCDNEDEE